jgi:hypothetical protein
MRRLIPEEHTPEWNDLEVNPVKNYLESVSNEPQARVVMATIQILSTHDADEEYLGQRNVQNWTNDHKVRSSSLNPKP